MARWPTMGVDLASRASPVRHPPRAGRLRALRLVGLVVLGWLALVVAAFGQSDDVTAPPLLDRLTPEVLAAVFDGVTRVEMVNDDGPVAAAAFRGDDFAGYVFSTLDVLRAPGYSSTPFDVVAGVALDGRITGAVVLFHREPYLINDAPRTARLVTFLASLESVEARLGAEGGIPPSFVAGATISARAMRNAVQEGGRMVLRYRTETVVVTEPTIDMINFKPRTTAELVADGGLVRALVTGADRPARWTGPALATICPRFLFSAALTISTPTS